MRMAHPASRSGYSATTARPSTAHCGRITNPANASASGTSVRSFTDHLATWWGQQGTKHSCRYGLLYPRAPWHHRGRDLLHPHFRLTALPVPKTAISAQKPRFHVEKPAVVCFRRFRTELRRTCGSVAASASHMSSCVAITHCRRPGPVEPGEPHLLLVRA